MPRLRFNNFKGEAPRVGERLLSDQHAIRATNCKLWSGEIRSWRKLYKTTGLIKTGFINAIYKLGGYWLHWTEVVHAVSGSIASDTTERTYFTGTDAPRVTDNTLVDIGGSGDYPESSYLLGIPAPVLKPTIAAIPVASSTIVNAKRTTPLELEVTGHNLVSGAWVKPDNCLGMVQINDNDYQITVIDANRFTLHDENGNDIAGAREVSVVSIGLTNPCEVKVVAHGLKSGASIYLASIGGTTQVNNLPFTITVVDEDNITLDGIDATAYTSYTGAGLLYVYAPYTASSGNLIEGYDPGLVQSTRYVYTYVSEWGEEGPPSPVSDLIDLGDGERVELSAFSAVPAGDYNILKIRIYRINSSDTTAAFQFVDEIALASAPYYDTVKRTELNEVLPSADWDAPPATMTGIITLPNGVMVGFTGNEVCISEPYQPHAYPVSYRHTTSFEIVALGNFGNTIVVTTKGWPSLIMCADPSVSIMTEIKQSHPCLSARGLLSLAEGVIFPTPRGLYLIGPGGHRLYTKQIITRDEFEDFYPSTIHAIEHDGRYFGFYSTGVVNGVTEGGGFIINNENGELSLTHLDFYAHAGWLDPDTGTLYLLIDNAGVNEIHEWEGSGNRLTYVWQSKTKAAPAKMRMAAGIIEADYGFDATDAEIAIFTAERNAILAANTVIWGTGDIGGALGSVALGMDRELGGDKLLPVPEELIIQNNVTLELVADGAVVSTKIVQDNKPFRFDPYDKARDFSVRVSGEVPIKDIRIATSIKELAS